MVRRWTALLILLAMLTGCGGEPVREAAPTQPETGETATDASDSGGAADGDATSDVDGSAGPQTCRGPVTIGPPSVRMDVQGIAVPLPLTECAVEVPAGLTQFRLLLADAEHVGKPVAATGADAAGWTEQGYIAEVRLNEGERRTVTLDLSPIGWSRPVAYTLIAAPALPAWLASGPSREGPWTPVPSGGYVPPDHGWLRIRYPLSMEVGGPSPVTPDQYALEGGLPGEWEGERTQYVSIAEQPPVLFLTARSDRNGLKLKWPVRTLYRSGPPELQRIGPETGEARTVYRFPFPIRASYRDGSVAFQRHPWAEREYLRVDPATGEVSPGEPPPERDRAERFRFPSPDESRVAELRFRDGLPEHVSRGRRYTADLVITDRETGEVLVEQPDWLTSWGSYSCAYPTPGFAWRADSGALAMLDAPERDRLVLKVVYLDGRTETVLEQTEPEDGYEQFHQLVSWSPSGQFIAVGPLLVEAGSGRVVAEGLSLYAYWSPDSRYLLLYQPDYHPFRHWGRLELMEVATGERRSLGRGQGLGWTPEGEALIVRWDVSRHIPPPGKGCP